VLNGRVLHGSQWSAGEIGYLRLPNVSRRRYPTIHEFGELETALSDAAILESWYERKGKSIQYPQEMKKIQAAEVLDLARTGNVRARKIVEHRAGMVSDIIVNLSLILNPGLILLSGNVGSHPVLIASVQKKLKTSEFAVTELAAGALGDTAALWGAISVALEVTPSVLLPQLTT
jgi:glucokinase